MNAPVKRKTYVLSFHFLDEEYKKKCQDLVNNCKARGKKKYNDEVLFAALTDYWEKIKNS